MISVHSDRITLNRPGYNPNVIPIGMHRHLKSTKFNSAIGSAESAIVAGANDFKAMLEMQDALPRVIDHYKRHHRASVVSATKAMMKALKEEKSRIEKIVSNGLAPLKPLNEAKSILVLQMLMNKKQSEVLSYMFSDRDVAALCLDPVHYRLLNLPEAGLDQLKEQIWRLNVQRNYTVNVASDQSLDDLLGEKPDTRLAADLADAAVAELEQSRDELKTVANWTRSIFDHVGAMSETSAADVFAMVRAA